MKAALVRVQSKADLGPPFLCYNDRLGSRAFQAT